MVKTKKFNSEEYEAAFLFDYFLKVCRTQEEELNSYVYSQQMGTDLNARADSDMLESCHDYEKKWLQMHCNAQLDEQKEESGCAIQTETSECNERFITQHRNNTNIKDRVEKIKHSTKEDSSTIHSGYNKMYVNKDNIAFIDKSTIERTNETTELQFNKNADYKIIQNEYSNKKLQFCIDKRTEQRQMNRFKSVSKTFSTRRKYEESKRLRCTLEKLNIKKINEADTPLKQINEDVSGCITGSKNLTGLLKNKIFNEFTDGEMKRNEQFSSELSTTEKQGTEELHNKIELTDRKVMCANEKSYDQLVFAVNEVEYESEDLYPQEKIQFRIVPCKRNDRGHAMNTYTPIRSTITFPLTSESSSQDKLLKAACNKTTKDKSKAANVKKIKTNTRKNFTLHRICNKKYLPLMKYRADSEETTEESEEQEDNRDRTGDQGYVCAYCNGKFDSRKTLSEHVLQKHSYK